MSPFSVLTRYSLSWF